MLDKSVDTCRHPPALSGVSFPSDKSTFIRLHGRNSAPTVIYSLTAYIRNRNEEEIVVLNKNVKEYFNPDEWIVDETAEHKRLIHKIV